MENFSVLFLMMSLCGVSSALLQLVFHLVTKLYFPSLHKFARYAMGALGMLVPPTFALFFFGAWEWALVIWASATASGLVVIAAEFIGERIREQQNKIDEHERLRKLLDGKTEKE